MSDSELRFIFNLRTWRLLSIIFVLDLFFIFPLWHCIALHCIQRSNHLSIQVFVVSWITRLCALCTNTEQNYLWNKMKIMTNRRLFNKIEIEIANVCVWQGIYKTLIFVLKFSKTNVPHTVWVSINNWTGRQGTINI